MHYWKVEGEAMNATELWRFRHRNGEQAYGDEPLEYWSDWEGSQSGDVAESTPYGWRLTDALKARRRGKDDEYETIASRIDEDSKMSPLMVYKAAEDPMTGKEVPDALEPMDWYGHTDNYIPRLEYYIEGDSDT